MDGWIVQNRHIGLVILVSFTTGNVTHSKPYRTEPLGRNVALETVSVGGSRGLLFWKTVNKNVLKSLREALLPSYVRLYLDE